MKKMKMIKEINKYNSLYYKDYVFVYTDTGEYALNTRDEVLYHIKDIEGIDADYYIKGDKAYIFFNDMVIGYRYIPVYYYNQSKFKIFDIKDEFVLYKEKSGIGRIQYININRSKKIFDSIIISSPYSSISDWVYSILVSMVKYIIERDKSILKKDTDDSIYEIIKDLVYSENVKRLVDIGIRNDIYDLKYIPAETYLYKGTLYRKLDSYLDWYNGIAYDANIVSVINIKDDHIEIITSFKTYGYDIYGHLRKLIGIDPHDTYIIEDIDTSDRRNIERIYEEFIKEYVLKLFEKLLYVFKENILNDSGNDITKYMIKNIICSAIDKSLRS